MATQYPQYPQGHPATYAPQRSIHGPYSNPQMGSTPSMPQRTSGQYRVDIYGRPLVQHGNGRSDSTPTGQAQYFPDRSGQAHPLSRGPSNQYSQSASGEPDSIMYAPRNVARGYPSQPNGRDDGFPTAQRSPESPKERTWICPHPGCLREDGQLMSFTRKDDLNRHIQRHVPNRQLYPCPEPGCHRVGENGLPRHDKLLEHLRETHRNRYGGGQ